MRLAHDPLKISASFDDPNLVSRAGLVPVMSLAERAGLYALARRGVAITGKCGVNAEVKIGCLVCGRAAGADSIDDMDLLRHGAMPQVFSGVRAPSTLGSFLRSFTWGNVLQLGKVSRELLAELARRAPLLPGADSLAFVDVDSTQRRGHGHQKKGAAVRPTQTKAQNAPGRGRHPPAPPARTPPEAPARPRARAPPGGSSAASATRTLRPGPGRASCSRPGATTRCSPTPRS